jgi:CRISPR-associated protein Cas1
MSSLYVDRSGVELELESDAIVFREAGERVGTVPIAPLTRVFLRGNVRLPAALLGKLGEAGVGVVVLSGRKGRPSLLLARPHNDADRRMAQFQRSLDREFCLDVARALVSRKVRRQIEWLADLRNRDPQVRYELTLALEDLKRHLAGIEGKDSLDSLRGAEGAAAARYFAGLKVLVPTSLRFSSRNRRPPRDPFNAILSLTYTMAHSELAIALHGAGFDPFIGFYHGLEFGRESLASDLLEPIRPMADVFALRLFRAQELRAEDFSNSEAGCHLGKAGRVRYYAAYEGFSEQLRAAINVEIERLAEQVGEFAQAQPKQADEDED